MKANIFTLKKYLDALGTVRVCLNKGEEEESFVQISAVKPEMFNCDFWRAASDANMFLFSNDDDYDGGWGDDIKEEFYHGFEYAYRFDVRNLHVYLPNEFDIEDNITLYDLLDIPA